MNTNTKTIVAIIAVLIIGVGMYAYTRTAPSTLTPSTNTPSTPDGTGASGDGVMCTMEAKMCPDGSYVGRSGPRCEFAACPVMASSTSTTSPTVTTGTVSVTAKLNEKVEALGVTIIPLELLEDSRCPVDVTCIQAGTIRLRTSILAINSRDTRELKLGVPFVTGSQTIELISALPVARSTQQPTLSQYRFEFRISRR